MKTMILVFAFGKDKTIASNQELALLGIKEAHGTSSMSDTVIFTEKDIDILPFDRSLSVKYYNQYKPQSTLLMAQAAAAYAIENKIEEVCIVAAKPHMERCYRDVKRIFPRTILLRRSHRAIKDYPRDYWFCRNSTQPWTRSYYSWIVREFILRLLPFPIYEGIVSKGK